MEKQINLAPSAKLSGSVWGKLLTWTLSAGRFIVVITELIVISAFLSRFFLDNRLRTLNEAIEQKTAIITANADFETSFRKIQSQLALAATITDSQFPTQNLLSDIESFLPQTIYLSQFSIANNRLTLKGIAPTEAGLTQLLYNLKTHPHLTKVSVGRLTTSSSESQGVEFNVTANWQPPAQSKS